MSDKTGKESFFVKITRIFRGECPSSDMTVVQNARGENITQVGIQSNYYGGSYDVEEEESDP